MFEPDLNARDDGPHSGQSGQTALKATLTDILQEMLNPDEARCGGRTRLVPTASIHERNSVILSLNRVLAIVAFRG